MGTYDSAASFAAAAGLFALALAVFVAFPLLLVVGTGSPVALAVPAILYGGLAYRFIADAESVAGSPRRVARGRPRMLGTARSAGASPRSLRALLWTGMRPQGRFACVAMPLLALTAIGLFRLKAADSTVVLGIALGCAMVASGLAACLALAFRRALLWSSPGETGEYLATLGVPRRLLERIEIGAGGAVIGTTVVLGALANLALDRGTAFLLACS